MTKTEDIALKILAGAFTASVAYIATTIGGNPPIDMQLLIYLVSGALALAVVWGIGVQKRFKESDERMDILDSKIGELMKSQQLLMRYRLLSDAREYIAQGVIAQEDLELWLEMYKSYERLGENGVLHEYHHKIVRLPVMYPKSNRKGL